MAEEVRKLAEQSREAAKKIAALIGEIQKDTDQAVVAMNDGTREVKAGAEIVEMVSHVSTQVSESSAAIQQIASESQQIVGTVKTIDKSRQDVVWRSSERLGGHGGAWPQPKKLRYPVKHWTSWRRSFKLK